MEEILARGYIVKRIRCRAGFYKVVGVCFAEGGQTGTWNSFCRCCGREPLASEGEIEDDVDITHL